MMLNQCSHLHIPLSDGWIEDGCVVCPWHQWKFNGDGACVWPPPAHSERIPVFEIQKKQDLLWVQHAETHDNWHTFLSDIHWLDVQERLQPLIRETMHQHTWSIVGIGEQTRVWCGGRSKLELQERCTALLDSLYDWAER